MAATPPIFQEAARCDVCNCSFTTFRRRHHCRCCGRTLCHEHSSNYMSLPQFGIYSSVRVCSDCLNDPSRSGGVGQISTGINNATDSFTKLNVTDDVDESAQPTSGGPIKGVLDCKCGMPLCICEAEIPDSAASAPLQMPSISTSSVQTKTRQRKEKSQSLTESTVQKFTSPSSSKPSPFLNVGQPSHGNFDEPSADYDVCGEGLREAIKKSDANAVKDLLNKGVDANYCDKQGFTLLHLAALFNQTEIVFILMDHGAILDCKNAQGETPIDCAPAMLQYKMRQKMGEGSA